MLLVEAKQKTEADRLKRAVANVMAIEAKQVPQTLTLTELQQLDPLVPHPVEASMSLESLLADEDVTWTFIALVRFYEGRASYTDAIHWAEQCLTIATIRFGENHLEIAVCLNNLAKLHSTQGNYPAAESLWTRSVQIRTRQLDPNHPDIAMGLSNLATLYEPQQRYEAAEPLYLISLQIREGQLGLEHPDVAQSLNNLGLLYEGQK